jgi:hypothetical protein
MPVSNASRDLFEKVETALVGQMSEIVNQICHDMLVACAAPTLKTETASVAQAMWSALSVIDCLE